MGKSLRTGSTGSATARLAGATRVTPSYEVGALSLARKKRGGSERPLYKYDRTCWPAAFRRLSLRGLCVGRQFDVRYRSVSSSLCFCAN